MRTRDLAARLGPTALEGEDRLARMERLPNRSTERIAISDLLHEHRDDSRLGVARQELDDVGQIQVRFIPRRDPSTETNAVICAA
jgi:hypothetical protein